MKYHGLRFERTASAAFRDATYGACIERPLPTALDSLPKFPSEPLMTKKEPALTPWFPASVNPARKGVYEVIYSGDQNSERRIWDGAHWTHADGVKCGFNMRLEGDIWRGLAEEPK